MVRLKNNTVNRLYKKTLRTILKNQHSGVNVMLKDQIKTLRLSRNMTQEDVANTMKVAKSTYIKYEKGIQSPQLETIETIAKFYGVSLSELIEDREPNIDKKLKYKLELINQLDAEEKKSIILMIEGLIFRRQNLELSKTLAQ